MSIGLSEFIGTLFGGSPFVIITVLLTLGVILVNGWTDAPNAIATCVSTRSIRPRAAIIMAAIFNFLGVFVMTAFNAKVASTIFNMVDFGENTGEATAALCAALFAIVPMTNIIERYTCFVQHIQLVTAHMEVVAVREHLAKLGNYLFIYLVGLFIACAYYPVRPLFKVTLALKLGKNACYSC